jgi:hypothetical protein
VTNALVGEGREDDLLRRREERMGEESEHRG